MIDKAMNTLSRAVMYLIIVPRLSANTAHIATNKLFCYRRSITLTTTSTPAIPISRYYCFLTIPDTSTSNDDNPEQ